MEKKIEFVDLLKNSKSFIKIYFLGNPQGKALVNNCRHFNNEKITKSDSNILLSLELN